MSRMLDMLLNSHCAVFKVSHIRHMPRYLPGIIYLRFKRIISVTCPEGLHHNIWVTFFAISLFHGLGMAYGKK